MLECTLNWHAVKFRIVLYKSRGALVPLGFTTKRKQVYKRLQVVVQMNNHIYFYTVTLQATFNRNPLFKIVTSIEKTILITRYLPYTSQQSCSVTCCRPIIEYAK